MQELGGGGVQVSGVAHRPLLKKLDENFEMFFQDKKERKFKLKKKIVKVE